MRRTAGTAIPTPTPITKRPNSRGKNERERASSTSPAMLMAMPASTSLRAWPRSANGAISTWARNPAKKPMPITAPRAPSLTPYSSRMSSSIENSAP